jgi:hypothetical protein
MEDSAKTKDLTALAALVTAVALVDNVWAFAGLIAVLACTLYATRK